MNAPGTAQVPRRSLLLAMVAVAVLATLAAAPGAGVRAAHGAHTTADEPHYLLTAISLAEDGDLDVSDEMSEERYRPFHEVGLRPQAARRPDGTLVVPHDPLLPLVLALPWRLGGWVGAKLALAVIAGLLAAVTLWLAVRRFGVGLLSATAVVALTAASVPLAPYGTQVYPELPAALALVLAVAAALGRPRAATAVAFVAAVVALPWLAVKYVPVAAAVATVGLWRWWGRGRHRLVAGAVGAFALAGVIYALAHLAWYGGLTVYAAGDFFQEHGGQLTVVGLDPDYPGRARRLVGLLIDDEFGIAAWQPLWLLTFPALVAWIGARREGWALVALPVAAGWLNATFVALTMQGWWFPGRQVVVVLPLVAVAIAALADRGGGWRATAVVTGALGVIAYAFLVIEGLQGRLRWVIDFASTRNPGYRLLKPLLPDYLDVTMTTWALQAAWIAVLGTISWLAWRRHAPSPPT